MPADPKPRKIPVRPDHPDCASSTDPATWGTFETALAHVGEHGTCGVGFVFTKMDGYVGIDLDDCLSEEGRPDHKTESFLSRFPTYTEESPSGTGLHLIARGSLNGHRGLNKKKENGIELYDSGRFFTFTGRTLSGTPSGILECQEAITALVFELDPPQALPPLPARRPRGPDVFDRARAYISRMPPAIAGQNGHDAAFSVAIALVKGFSLDVGASMDLMREFSSRCVPPWSEKELLHKITDAEKAEVPDGYILDRDPPPAPRPSAAPALRLVPPVVTATEASTAPKRVVRLTLPEVIRGIKRRNPFPLGLQHLDDKLGGGLSAGDSLVIGGGPGSCKTTMLSSVIRSFAGPRTAIFAILFDEHYERVCRKIAARFGLKFSETEEATTEVMARLEAELVSLSAYLEIIDPRTSPSVEEIVSDCLATTPEGRTPIFMVDHLHRLYSDTASDRDQASVAVTKVVDAALRATNHGAILYAISEVTKAALSADVVRANPMSVFADSRAIASRFDVSFAVLLLPPTDGSFEVLTEVIGTGKNRFGQGHGSFITAVDTSSWEVTTRDAEGNSVEADEKKAAVKWKARYEAMTAHDDLVLSYIAAHAVSQEIGMSRRSVIKGVPASSELSERHAEQALIRLVQKHAISEYERKAPGKPGSPPVFVRILGE